MSKDKDVTLRQAYVKVPIALVADALFGPGVEIVGVFRTPQDDAECSVTFVVSGHESLPVMAEGDTLTAVVPEITEHIHGVKTTEFRAFQPKRH